MSESNAENTPNIANTSDASEANVSQAPLDRTKNDERNLYKGDYLAITTRLLKEGIDLGFDTLEYVKHNEIFRSLTKISQPIAVLLIGIVTFILFTFWNKKRQDTTSWSDEEEIDERHPYAVFVFFAAFAAHFGTQIWMNFVSGFLLYFTLPRQLFGQSQKILFPKYFALNGVLSILMNIVFVRYLIESWSYLEFIQLITLALNAIIEVTIRLLYIPPYIRSMQEKYKIEEENANSGEAKVDLLQNQNYIDVDNIFRRTHSIIDVGVIAIMLFSCINLFYIASKTNFYE